MILQILEGDCVELLRSFPDACIDAVVTDPPYGLSREPDALDVLRHWLAGDDYTHRGGGFMGKSWDSFVPGPAVWREVLRVLKPGGHALVFSGTRTYDLTVLAMRIAGFEIRDQLAWMYGSGFPKSLDVSKAIDSTDAAKARLERAFAFTAWLRSTGITAAKIDEITRTRMGNHYTTHSTQPCIATREHFEQVRPHLTAMVPVWVEQLVDERTVESENLKRREVVGEYRVTSPGCNMRAGLAGQEPDEIGRVTAPATPEAQQWAGWGTALKPAQEPIALARKPLIGTVAANVLAHGTGALNIDACRIGTDGGGTHCTNRDAFGKCRGHRNEQCFRETFHGPDTEGGRWPANVLFDEVAAAMLDEQSGTSKSSGGRGGDQLNGFVRANTGGLGDSGGASRFFYVAKASRAEREAGLEAAGLALRTGGELTDRVDGSDGLNSPRAGAGRGGGRRNHHPTVKPIELMRYLIRLITPPGGTVLDPYAGSGTTGAAAALEGVHFVGCEITPEYLPIARARIAHYLRLAHAETVERFAGAGARARFERDMGLR